MQIELEIKCKYDPANRIVFCKSDKSETIYIEAHKGNSIHLIAISAYELEVITNVFLKIPLEEKTDRQELVRAYDGLPPQGCQI